METRVVPTYEYLCNTHGKFERMAPVDKRKKAICFKCGATCKIVPSLPGGFLLKGDGFYSTENRKGKK